jgi:phosphoribosylformylglycinamidine (FGAM) synthase-like enzyme
MSPPSRITTAGGAADADRLAQHAARRWVWEQYDTLVQGRFAADPGGDAGVVRVDGTAKALAFTSDVTPRYVEADPFEGGKQAVAECWRNLTAVGAEPLATTDNLNFGNPERPEIMGQLVGAIKGIGEACTALDMPIVSGNVSLYNETNGEAILPTPTIGGVGLMPDWHGHGAHRLECRRRRLPDRRRRHASGPVGLHARLSRPRGRRAAAGRISSARRSATVR